VKVSRSVNGILTAVLLTAAVVAPPTAGAAAAEPGTSIAAEQRLLELERELAELRAALAASSGGTERLAELERRIDILAAEIEKLRLGETAVAADSSVFGLGPAASKVYRSTGGVSIGGYGELLYENYAADRDDGTAPGKTDQADMLRAIVYFGYKFSDRLLLNTEVEFEHGTTSDGTGEVSVEFAYLDYLWRDEVNLRGGMVLLPVGLVNELHEPTVFLTAKRPGVEQAIIPTTWRENGFGLFGEIGDWSYRTYLVNGLDGSGFAASGLRGGRQKGAKARAEDLAWTGRVDYQGVAGLTVGVSGYIGDSGQGRRGTDGALLNVRTALLEAHADWRFRALTVRGLVVRAEVDDVAALNASLGLTGDRSVGTELAGGYLEAGYDILAGRGGTAALTPFARWEYFDTQRAVPSGFARNPANDVEILTLGVAYKPLPQVVLKADWQDVDNAAGTGVDQFNVALGYIF